MQHKSRQTYAHAITERLFEPDVAPMSLSMMASIMGKAGGLKGGPARAMALSPKRRSEIAKQAAEKRWGARR